MAYYRTGTNDFSSLQYTNLEKNNISKNVNVIIKDPNDQILKTVTGNSPVLIGTYTGNQTINISSYKRTTDTVDNFIIEITEIGRNVGQWYCDGSIASTGISSLTISGSSPTKVLSGNNLVISGMTCSASMYMYGNVAPNPVSTSVSYTYKLYHI